MKKYNIVLCRLLVLGLLFTGCGRRSSSSDNIVVTVVATDNKIPTARALTLVTDEDKNFNITLVGEDEDGDTLTYIVVENPSHGTLSGTAPNLLYTPDGNYSGTDSFTYKVNDGSVDSVIAIIDITINAIQIANPNKIPTARALTFVTDEDKNFNITLVGEDEDGDTLTYIVVENPSHGTLSGTAPNLLYTPDGNYSGTDSFTYKVNDGSVDSVIATIDITINAIQIANPNKIPTARALTLVTDKDKNFNITLVGEDEDGDTLTYIVVENPSHGTLSGTAPNLLYTPDGNYSGTDSFTYKVNDGSVDSVIATIDITINAIQTANPNKIPTARALTFVTDEDKNFNITLVGEDEDGDTLTYIVVENPSHGTLSGTAPNLLYTPDGNYSGTDSFTYKVNDGSVDSVIATIDITINAIQTATKKTGQTNSYDASGNEVTDGSLKDDGYYQKGVTPQYTRASDIVTDELTELMWQDNAAVASVTKTWLTNANYNTCSNYKNSPVCYNTSGDTAATYCSDLTLGGYTDWRLPTSTELEGIIDYGKHTLAIDTAYFKNVSSDYYSNYYWSSTSYEEEKRRAWIVDFYRGDVGRNVKRANGYVRCVRDGQ